MSLEIYVTVYGRKRFIVPSSFDSRFNLSVWRAFYFYTSAWKTYFGTVSSSFSPYSVPASTLWTCAEHAMIEADLVIAWAKEKFHKQE